MRKTYRLLTQSIFHIIFVVVMSYYGNQGQAAQPPAGGPGMLQMPSIVNPQQEKINRELFVGNTPPGTSEKLIQYFLSAAMRRTGLCGEHELPIVDSRVNNKFAFIELMTTELADKALALNGIPFLGVYLKVSRPSKFVPLPGINKPPPAQTWQQLTGQSLPDGASGALLDPEQEKLSRELFIGNTTPEMTETMIREFLGNAMQQVGLTQPGMTGNPITACRVSGKFAFIELRTAEEAGMALNLNNIPFLGTALRVGRPSKWNGPVDQHGNWEDILAKYMAGEINVVGQQAAQQQQAQAAQQTPTRVVELLNMLTPEDVANDEELADIVEDTREECSQFGQLVNITIPKGSEVGATKIFLEYASVEDATKALQALEGRTFDGRQVVANYYDEAKYESKDYS